MCTRSNGFGEVLASLLEKSVLNAVFGYTISIGSSMDRLANVGLDYKNGAQAFKCGLARLEKTDRA